MKSVKELNQENKRLHNKINEYEEIINKIKKQIKENERIIWITCDHQWKRDYDVAFDDNCKYFCEKCYLWNNVYFYK